MVGGAAGTPSHGVPALMPSSFATMRSFLMEAGGVWSIREPRRIPFGPAAARVDGAEVILVCSGE